MFLAHVRASTGTAISRNNCHPFVHGRWAFMHNGQVGGFERFRRHADIAIPDHLYPDRKGATDSEALFLLALAEGLDGDPVGALRRAAQQLVSLSRERGEAPHGRFTCAFTDGERLFVLRTSTDRIQPSAFFRRWPNGGLVVASEPLDGSLAAWERIPHDSLMEFSPNGVSRKLFEISQKADAA
jgi:glutamine amidotransferase